MSGGDELEHVPGPDDGAGDLSPGDAGASGSDGGSSAGETPTGTSAASTGDSLAADFTGADQDFVGGPRGRGDTVVGRTIGGVHIQGFVADGGMGRVYSGRQVKTGRPVALKLVQPGRVSPGTLRRFEYEAHVLGSLEHDGIVRVLHADTAEVDGVTQPFIVMDLVPRALRLDGYARQAGLDERGWMELFRGIASAVAAAHARGVIHRDLKPGNILVTAEGRPRVIDFGVALVRDPAVSMGQPTEDGTAGTPRYMSPEQARGGSEDIDVRSDVYSLGVVMYEVLGGRMPYEIKAPTNAASVINDVPPEPLAAVRPDLSRDVCTIVMKCLAKERTDRYSTAAELAADMGRFLRDEAIVAAAPSAYDTMRRFCRKHRALAVSATSIVATLLLALGVVTYFFLEAERGRKDVQVALSRLEDEQHIGDQLLGVVVRAIGGPRPSTAAETLDLRDQLVRAADDVLTEQPQGGHAREVVVKARFLRAIGEALLAIGRPVEAREQFRTVLQILETVPGIELDDELARTLGCLGHAALECGEFAEAIDAGKRAAALAARPRDADIDIKAAVVCQAMALMSLGHRHEAAVLYEKIQSRVQNTLSNNDPDRAVLLTNHGEILRRREEPGDLATAEEKHRAAVAIWNRQRQHDDPREGVTLNNLGEVLRLTNRHGEAEECHEQALELHRATLAPGHFLISTGLSKLAEVYRLDDRFADAEALLAEALAIREAAGLADHLEAALLHWRLALVFDATGRPREAEAARRRCLEIRRARLGEDHRDTRAVAEACRAASALPGGDTGDVTGIGRLAGNLVEEDAIP